MIYITTKTHIYGTWVKHRNTQYCTIKQKYNDGLIFPPSKEVTPGVKRTMYTYKHTKTHKTYTYTGYTFTTGMIVRCSRPQRRLLRET